MTNRDAIRLPIMYSALEAAHRQLPDLRFFQFIDAFKHWVTAKKERDPFYVEDTDMLNYLNEFMKEVKK